MAEKPTDGLFKRLGRGFDRYVGGLLGEDLEGMSPEEKAAARRSVIGIIGRGMIDPAQGSEALGAVTQARAQQRAQAEVARRTAAAEAEMPRIAGRLFGGSAGMIETLPGQPEEESRLMTSRYRINPQDALARLTGTQVGRDVAKLAPDLATLASEGVTGRTVGGAVYNPLTGGFSRPPEAEVKTLTPQEVARLGLPRGTLVQRDQGGELKILREPPRMATGGGGERFKILTPDEVKANNLPPGTYQQNIVTNQITRMQGQDSGGLGEVELRQYNAASLAIKNARSNIQNLTDTLARVSPVDAVAGEGRGELEGAYTLALGAVRELQNSGVLNVGEIPFLEKALRDPTTFGAIVASPVRRKELAGQIRTIMTLLNQKESNLQNVYPQGQPPPQNGALSSANPVVPTNQRRAPSPEARSRAENYYSEGD
jgi:hypothetical protein